MSETANNSADVIEISSIKEGGTSWALKVRQQAKALSGELELHYMDLAKLLYYVCDKKSIEPPFEPIYRTWGYSSFENYAEEELGINEGKAKALRRVWYRIEVELIDLPQELKAKLIKLGWSKVNQLIKILTPINAEQWVQRAQEENYATLAVSIRQYQNNIEKAQKQSSLEKLAASGGDSEIPGDLSVPMPPKQKLYHKYLYFTESQYEIIETALSKASMLFGKANDAAIITSLLTEWLATTVTGDTADSKVKYFSKFETQTDVDLIVVDKQTDRIVYGFETLERIASKSDEETSKLYGESDATDGPGTT